MPSLPASKPQPAARDKAPETSILAEAQEAEVEQANELPPGTTSDASPSADRESELAALVKADSATRESELSALVRAMQARLDQLEGRQNESYADDDKLFIAKSAGEQWSERRLDTASKRYVDVQMQATAFFGSSLRTKLSMINRPTPTPMAESAMLKAGQ